MDESNHEMVNMLTQQIGTVFNPLIQNTNWSYELLANQMGLIVDLFGASQAQGRPTPPIQNARPMETHNNEGALVNQQQQQLGFWPVEPPIHREG